MQVGICVSVNETAGIRKGNFVMPFCYLKLIFCFFYSESNTCIHGTWWKTLRHLHSHPFPDFIASSGLVWSASGLFGTILCCEYYVVWQHQLVGSFMELPSSVRCCVVVPVGPLWWTCQRCTFASPIQFILDYLVGEAACPFCSWLVLTFWWLLVCAGP